MFKLNKNYSKRIGNYNIEWQGAMPWSIIEAIGYIRFLYIKKEINWWRLDILWLVIERFNMKRFNKNISNNIK